MDIIEFLRKQKRDEIFCKGCDQFDRYTKFPCIYKLKTNRCPKQDKLRGNMKVKECRKCIHSKSYRWSSSYKPANYHCVGVSHVYRYCELHEDRCLNIRGCKDASYMGVNQ